MTAGIHCEDRWLGRDWDCGPDGDGRPRSITKLMESEHSMLQSFGPGNKYGVRIREAIIEALKKLGCAQILALASLLKLAAYFWCAIVCLYNTYRKESWGIVLLRRGRTSCQQYRWFGEDYLPRILLWNQSCYWGTGKNISLIFLKLHWYL